jgi:hypothetical protein
MASSNSKERISSLGAAGSYERDSSSDLSDREVYEIRRRFPYRSRTK